MNREGELTRIGFLSEYVSKTFESWLSQYSVICSCGSINKAVCAKLSINCSLVCFEIYKSNLGQVNT
jgi:hypothetical protein